MNMKLYELILQQCQEYGFEVSDGHPDSSIMLKNELGEYEAFDFDEWIETCFTSSDDSKCQLDLIEPSLLLSMPAMSFNVDLLFVEQILPQVFEADVNIPYAA